MNKAQVKQAREEAVIKAKRLVKTWYKNGWGVQTAYCYDVAFPDGSRIIDIRDKHKINGFDFIFVDNAFAIVSYDGKLKVTIP